MASSPPGVDMMRSWMLVTEGNPPRPSSEPGGEPPARALMGAVERWPGRWFSEASKYLCLLLCMSFRSERQGRDQGGQRPFRGGGGGGQKENQSERKKETEEEKKGGETSVRRTGNTEDSKHHRKQVS